MSKINEYELWRYNKNNINKNNKTKNMFEKRAMF